MSNNIKQLGIGSTPIIITMSITIFRIKNLIDSKYYKRTNVL